MTAQALQALAYGVTNGAVDGAFLWLTARVLRLPLRRGPWLVAAVVGAAWALVPWTASLAQAARLAGPPVLVGISFGVLPLGGFFTRSLTLFALALAAGSIAFVSVAITGGTWPAAAGALPALGLSAVALVTVSWPVARARLRSAMVREASDRLVQLRLRFRHQSRVVGGLVDTGNRLMDPVGGQPVLVVESRALAGLVPDALLAAAEACTAGDVREPEHLESEWRRRLRLVPYRSVGGPGWLFAVRADGLRWADGTGRQRSTGPVVLALAPRPLGLPDGAVALVPAGYLAHKAAIADLGA